MHGGTNRGRAVDRHLEIDGGWKQRAEPGQVVANAIDGVDHVRTWRRCDDHRDSRASVDQTRRPDVLHAICYRAEIGEAHDCTLAGGHDQWQVVGGLEQLVVAMDLPNRSLFCNLAFWAFPVRLRQYGPDLLQ